MNSKPPLLTGCGLAIIIPLGLVAIAMLLLVTSFVAGWCAVPFKVFSADNVQEQWEFAYTYDESLSAIARQACSVKKLEAEATGSEATQRRTQLLAIEQNYARVASEYNARLRNAFKAKLVRPPDVPEVAPSYNAKLNQVCH